MKKERVVLVGIVTAIALAVSFPQWAHGAGTIIELEAEYNQYASVVISNQQCLYHFGEGFDHAARMERFDGAKLMGCFKKQLANPKASLENQGTPWFCLHPNQDNIIIQWEPTKVQQGQKYSCFEANRFLMNPDGKTVKPAPQTF